MRSLFPALLTLLATSVVAAPAQEIVAITPSTAAPGTLIRISGGPFTPDLNVLLGNRLLTPETLDPAQFTFTLPELAPGDYVLGLTRGDRAAGQRFLFRIVAPPPTITSLAPTRLDLCTVSGDPLLSVSGQHFAAGAKLLLDGAALPSGAASSSQIEANLPPLPAGLHRIEVVNPDGLRSLAQVLYVDGTPSILAVRQVEDRVVAYDLLIEGNNFQANTVLLVNGVTVAPVPAAGSEAGAMPRESLRFLDCQTLLYTRHPVSREPRELILRAVTGSGSQSSPFFLTAP